MQTWRKSGILSCGASRSQDFRLQSLRVTFPFQVFFAKLSGNICRTVAVAILVQTGVVLRVGDGTWMNPWMKPYWDQCLNSGEQSFSPFRRYLQPEKMQEKCVVSFFPQQKTVLRKNEDSWQRLALKSWSSRMWFDGTSMPQMWPRNWTDKVSKRRDKIVVDVLPLEWWMKDLPSISHKQPSLFLCSKVWLKLYLPCLKKQTSQKWQVDFKFCLVSQLQQGGGALWHTRIAGWLSLSCFSLRPGMRMRCCRKDLWSKIWDVVATSQRTTEAMIPKCLRPKRQKKGGKWRSYRACERCFWHIFQVLSSWCQPHDSSWRFISHSQPRQSQRLCTSCCWSTWGLSQKMEPWRSLSRGHDEAPLPCLSSHKWKSNHF